MEKAMAAGLTMTAGLSCDTRVVHGDAIEILKENSDWKFQLVFADPPFNIGQEYDEHDDKISDAEYKDWSHEWIGLAANSLTDSGVLVIHGDDDVTELTLPIARHHQLERIDWVVWHFRFGQCVRSKCIRSKAQATVWRRNGKQHFWNPYAVATASDRASKYKDPRTKDSQTPGLRVPLDVWGIPSDGPYFGRVQGNNRERVSKQNGYLEDHPNQLPELYMQRWILGFTNPGDRVLDPFGGTGTTAVVGNALGREVTTIEKSQSYVSDIERRISLGAVRISKDCQQDQGNACE